MGDLNLLADMWQLAKEAEKQAQDRRRYIEDRLLSLIGVVATMEGTENHEAPDYKIKIVGRLNRKVDSNLLQDLAQEHGLEAQLQELFRWQPEINLKAWKATSSDITKCLEPAITTTPGRPTFTITKKED